MDTLTLPKRTREGSFTTAQIEDAIATLDALPEGSREAVVVERGHDSENAARNRARLLGAAMTDKTGVLYSAHAVPDPDADGKFIGAVSVRTNQNPRQPAADRPKNAPTMRVLQQAARDLVIKGRSKLDYDGLWTAIEAAGVDPNSYGRS